MGKEEGENETQRERERKGREKVGDGVQSWQSGHLQNVRMEGAARVRMGE